MSKILNLRLILMKKAKKIFKVLFIITIIFVSTLIAGSFTYYQIVTHGISLDTNKLELSTSANSLCIYDSNFNEIKPTSASYIKLSKLSSDTKNAFICAEDKRFYKHKGIDIVRIGGAIVSNVKSHSFSQGASTISQQLVKNTQLSNEKTINRKLKEFKLTSELEKKYSKDEILELYLNNIYFGNGCYGVENASKHYFNKSASALTLSESALLAGSINAPSVYDIENNPDKAIKRRDLILELMEKYGKITKEQKQKALQEKPNLNISEISGNSALFKNIISEACSILKTSEFNLNSSNYKIYTMFNKKLYNDTKKIIDSTNLDANFDAEIATIVCDNKTHSIVMTSGKSKILNNKWQPGSTIKPILVFAPAIEKGLISPATKLLDNKINISGYSPENADKKYHGFISAKTALAKSYNIPAVKILNELGVEEAKSFAKSIGIEFEKSDNHLALALGGFEKGISPKSILDAYSAFACGGNFEKSTYITKITKNGKTVFEKQNAEKQVMSESTAFLINDMLTECVKNGTAKRLNDIGFTVASKTGTVGKANSSKNSVAYNVAYTPEHTIITMICGDNLSESVNGATYPTIINKEILSSLYKTNKPTEFKIPTSVKSIKLDKKSYEENSLVETQNDDGISAFFAKSNLPKSEIKPYVLSAINSPNHKPILCFTINTNADFFLIRTHKNKEETVFSSLENNENFIKFCDKTAKNNEIYTYKLKICDKSKNEEFYSNEIKLKTY